MKHDAKKKGPAKELSKKQLQKTRGGSDVKPTSSIMKANADTQNTLAGALKA